MFSSNSPSVRPVGVPAVAAQRGAPATPVRARHDRGQLVRRLALCGVALLGVVSCAIAFRDVDSGKLLAALSRAGFYLPLVLAAPLGGLFLHAWAWGMVL